MHYTASGKQTGDRSQVGIIFAKEPPRERVVNTAIAHYDNSPNNPYNPDPNAEVFWGDQTWDEMLAGFVDFAIPVNMDPNELGPPKKVEDNGQKARGE